MCTEFLHLRSIAIVGAFFWIGFHTFSNTSPAEKRGPILWCIAFIIINLVQISILLAKETKLEFSEEELEVFEKHFGADKIAQLSPRQFHTLLRSGAEWRRFDTGQAIIKQGVQQDHMILITQGAANVFFDKKLVNKVEPGTWLGEIAVVQGLQDHVATASVIATEPTRGLSWPREKLLKAFTENEQLSGPATKLLTADLVRKLTS